MVKFGRAIRWKNDFYYEIKFSKDNGFEFMQIWYYQGSLLVDGLEEPRENTLKECGFPIMIHALLDINEFDIYIPKLIKILKFLDHKEVIIHPVCTSEEITEKSIIKLVDKVLMADRLLRDEHITLMLENNSKLDPIHYKTEEIKYMFEANPNIELLLDIAHIDSYVHLKEIINIKWPKVLHIADKRFSQIHEHLPIGAGELDFDYIFGEILSDFDGKIILEITQDDESIIKSLEVLKKL